MCILWPSAFMAQRPFTLTLSVEPFRPSLLSLVSRRRSSLLSLVSRALNKYVPRIISLRRRFHSFLSIRADPSAVFCEWPFKTYTDLTRKAIPS